MIKLTDLTLEERETIMTMSGDDRGVWKIYCDDLVMIERFMKLGLQVTEERKGGGKCFLVPANQVTIRKKRVLSEEERERKRQQAMKSFGRSKVDPLERMMKMDDVDVEDIISFVDEEEQEDN